MSSKRFRKLPKKNLDLPAKSIDQLLAEVKKNCTTKFEESIDLSIQINNKQKKNEINIRTVVNLPGGTGKKIKVAVVCEEVKISEAKEAGADIVGADEFIEKIKNGEMNFEKLICTPGMMIKLSKLGKILGPKGLMPNPKTGTVTEKVGEAINNAKSGQVRFRTDKNGILHGCIGKVSFSSNQIQENAAAMLEEVKKLMPATAKGAYIQSVALSSTMGPGVKVAPASFVV